MSTAMAAVTVLLLMLVAGDCRQQVRLYYSRLHWVVLHCTAMYCTVMHLYFKALQFILLKCTALQFPVLYFIPLKVLTEFGCEGSSVLLQCGEGEGVTVVRANYGRWGTSW